MFALNWLTGFRGEDLNNFPHADILKRAYLCQVRDTGSPEYYYIIQTYFGHQGCDHKEV
jgi:hypothetical protein